MSQVERQSRNWPDWHKRIRFSWDGEIHGKKAHRHSVYRYLEKFKTQKPSILK